MARLEVQEGCNAGESFVVQEEALIGRSLSNSICLTDGRASRHHARITQRQGTYYIEDLESANGTVVRGESLTPGTPVPLEDGDTVQICSTRMIFRNPQAAPTRQRQGDLAGALGANRGDTSRVMQFNGLSVTMMPDEGKAEKRPSVNAAVDVTGDEKDIRAGEDLSDALRRLQAMIQVSEALGNILDREQVMERIIDTLFEIFPAAERAFILLRDAAGELTPVAARKRQADAAAPEEVAVSRSIVDDVVRNRRAVLSSDALSDDRFQNQVSVVNLSIRSLMCAPLAVGEEIVGVLQVDTSQGIRTFTQEDLKVLSGIAAQAAISVKNAQLYESLEMETSRRTSLERYFSPNMVELMMSGDVASELGGRTYRGTVFFSDIIGFTEISESMRPEDVVSNLNRYFQIMQKLIYDNGGNVDKFGGDAIMAFWSVPKYVEGDELRSVLTGVQMQAKVWPFNLELVAEGQRPIHMGIGINTGEFVAGNIGSEDKIEFTLIGDNVNLAARIEERAGRHQVLVSESTWERIRDRVCAVRLPAVGFKGKSGESTIYSIRGAQRSEEEWALAIPCHVDGPSGNGAGVLIAMSGSGAERQVVLNTTGDAQPGQTLELRLACPEWHAPLALQGRVMARSDLEVGAGLTYGRIVLGALQGTASLEMLCPGACLCTECSWEEMARG